MKRRDILRYTALVTGTAVSAPLISTLLSGCSMPESTKTAFKPIFFTESELNELTVIVDTILPKTDSPSASEVGVHQIIDNMVGSVYNDNDRRTYRQNYDFLVAFLASESSFRDLPESDRISMLLQAGKHNDNGIVKAYTDLRQQTIAYYLSTEEVSKNHLNYLPIPGGYDACISVDEVENKAWAI